MGGVGCSGQAYKEADGYVAVHRYFIKLPSPKTVVFCENRLVDWYKMLPCRFPGGCRCPPLGFGSICRTKPQWETTIAIVGHPKMEVVL